MRRDDQVCVCGHSLKMHSNWRSVGEDGRVTFQPCNDNGPDGIVCKCECFKAAGR